MHMEYHFELAGLHTVLCTPKKMEISQRLRPFLIDPQTNADCTIRVQEVTELPQMSNFGTWYGPEYYDHKRIFHCTADARTPFAVTELLEDGNVKISVLPAYLSWFSGFSGIFNRIGLENLLLQHHGLLLHASLIDHGIAFSGPSGIGKSTQAALWAQYAGAEILNGDRAAIRKTGDGWFAYGSPYAGTSGIYRRGCAKLRAIVVLGQSEENSLRKLSATEAFAKIYPEMSVHRWDREFAKNAADLCIRMLEETPVYLLECRPDETAVQLLRKGLDL